jgi:hypothetical protein
MKSKPTKANWSGGHLLNKTAIVCDADPHPASHAVQYKSATKSSSACYSDNLVSSKQKRERDHKQPNRERYLHRFGHGNLRSRARVSIRVNGRLQIHTSEGSATRAFALARNIECFFL